MKMKAAPKENFPMKNGRALSISALVRGLLVIAASLICSTAAQAQSGAATFKANCTPCHGPDGSADTPTGKALKAADLRSPDVQKKTDEDLATFIANGKGNMPPFKATLSESQIKDVVTFVRTLKKK
jgi:mono/diheme cytochrome c family protein